MDFSRLQILLVDDDEDDYVMTQDLLSEITGWAFVLTWVSTYDEALGAMQTDRFDVLLVDYHLGEANGLDLIRQISHNGCHVPVILLTGQGDREIDLEAMKAGAADYLDKGEISSALLERSIRNAIERYRLQSQLKAGEDRLKSIINNNVDGIIITDRHRNIHFMNPAAENLFGRGMDSFDRRLSEIPDETDKPMEIVLVRDNGKSVIAEMRVAQIEWNGEDAYLASIRDITERKLAEEMIHKLTQQLLKTQESERDKLARDLHDSVAQQLSALKIGIDTLFDSCEEVALELKQKSSRCSSILSDLIAEIRNLAYNLCPAGIEYLGLSQSVFQYCEEFSHITGIHVDFMGAGMEEVRLDSETEINLFRILQEALNNVQKHAGASEVKVRLTVSYPKIILRIEDNGKGFDVKKRLVSAMDEKCMGLWNMQERVKLINGNMKLNSRRNHGTQLCIEVYLDKDMASSR